MKRITILLLLIAAADAGLAQNADDILGIYHSIDPFSRTASQCEVFKEADGTYSGKVVWVEKQKNNPNIGLVFMKGLVYNAEDNEYQKGKIKYPGRKGTFRTYIRMTDNNSIMRLRGYLGISLFGKTVNWTREDKVRGY